MVLEKYEFLTSNPTGSYSSLSERLRALIKCDQTQLALNRCYKYRVVIEIKHVVDAILKRDAFVVSHFVEGAKYEGIFPLNVGDEILLCIA